MSQIRMTPMAINDINDVVAIEKRAFKNPWGKLAFINELACNGAYNFVLKTGQRQHLIAYFCFRLIMAELHVLKVAVTEEYRNKGIASYFFRRCLNAIPDKFDLAFLEVRPSNIAAIRLYKKLGFSVNGKRPGYYTDTDEDAIMMGKIFKGGSYGC
ncbi:MAG: ribosomal protein S18-alanine N-acetyltransferase [Desulfobacterales bacterium]|nr:ribosomal protein S18-alanine N-acetyltransferase [Desulfobacterales bacterium]